MEQHPLKLAAIPCNIGPDAVPAKLTALAQRAEALGYESLWTFEHVIVPHQYASRYPYHPSGKMGAAPDTNFLDPLIALTYLAAATKHLRFGTGVNILPQVNPLLLAKQAATLDFLSGGRLLLGLGVGWLKEEFEAMGADFAHRGTRCTEYIQALRAAWQGGADVSFKGQFLQWQGFGMSPQPAQAGGIPVVVGGVSKAAIRRVARHGDGWFIVHDSLETLDKLLAQLKAVCEQEQRDVSEIELTAFWHAGKDSVDMLRAYQDRGIARVMVSLLGSKETPATVLEMRAEQMQAA